MPNCFEKAKFCDFENHCLFGDYCEDGICQSCQEGNYCPDGNDQLECPRNYYCSKETVQPVRCPPGTSSMAGTASIADCVDNLNKLVKIFLDYLNRKNHAQIFS